MEIKIRDKRNRGWFYVDNDYLNGFAKIVGPIGTSLYLALCRHADAEQKCFPSQELLAEELGISERTVRKYIKTLQDHKIIYVERDKNKDGQWERNLYYLLDKSEWVKPEESGASGVGQRNLMSKPEANDDKNQRHEVPTKDTKYKNTKKKNTNKLYRFDDFWEVYPRKVNKKKAQQKWEKLEKNDELVDKIISDVRKRLEFKEWKKEEISYIPHPTTYLNGERWEDEVVDNRKKELQKLSL